MVFFYFLIIFIFSFNTLELQGNIRNKTEDLFYKLPKIDLPKMISFLFVDIFLLIFKGNLSKESNVKDWSEAKRR